MGSVYQKNEGQEIEGEEREEGEEIEIISGRGKRCYLCLTCSKHSFQILAGVVIALVYIFVELFKTIFKDEDGISRLLCSMHFLNMSSPYTSREHSRNCEQFL